MSSKLLKATIVSFTLAISSVANAGLIYSNGAVDLENFGGWFSDTDGSNWQVYDDFSLSSANSIASIDFWGSFWSSGAFEGDLAFSVNVYGDSGGVDLGNFIGTSTLSVFSQTDTGEDHNNNGTADIYKFSADLDSMINIGDTDSYWISVFATSGTDSTAFTWQEVSDTGNATQWDGSVFNARNVTTAFDLYDQARSENSVDIPEPPVLYLMVLGLAGMVSRRLRS